MNHPDQNLYGHHAPGPTGSGGALGSDLPASADLGWTTPTGISPLFMG